MSPYSDVTGSPGPGLAQCAIAKQFPNQFAVSRLFAKYMNKQLGHVQDAHTSDLYSVNELSNITDFLKSLSDITWKYETYYTPYFQTVV